MAQMGALCGVPGVFRSCLLGPTPQRSSLHELAGTCSAGAGTTNAPSDGWRLAVVLCSQQEVVEWMGLGADALQHKRAPILDILDMIGDQRGGGIICSCASHLTWSRFREQLQTDGRHTAGDRPAAGRATACHCKRKRRVRSLGVNARQTVTT